MIDSVLVGGAALKVGEWLLNTLSQGNEASPGEKVLGNIAMACIGNAASDRLTDMMGQRDLRPASEPLNNHIEQAYRLAEFGALVLFLNRTAENERFSNDPYAGTAARQVIEDISTRFRTVRANRSAAYGQGLHLEHLAATLSSMSANEWNQANEHAQTLRRQVEDRALEELHIAFDKAPSTEFVAAFRHGSGSQVPPWFGLLAHNFVHVLLKKDDARNSVMLRLVSRMSLSVQPGVDIRALENRLKQVMQESGSELSDRIAGAMTTLGDGLGSNLVELGTGIDEIASRIDAFRSSWDESLEKLASNMGLVVDFCQRQEIKLDQIHEKVDELLRRRHSPAVAPENETWPNAARTSAGPELPGMPFEDREPVGRTDKVAEIASFLANERLRLLRIDGRGGSGKTMLVSFALHSFHARTQPVRPVIYLRPSEAQPQVMDLLLESLDAILRGVGLQGVAANCNLTSLEAKLDHLANGLREHQQRPIVVLDSMEWSIDDVSHRFIEHDLERFMLHCLESHLPIQVILISQQLPAVEHDGQVSQLIAVECDRQIPISLGIGLAEHDAVVLLRTYFDKFCKHLQTVPEELLRRLCRSVGGNPNAIKHIAVVLAGDRLLDPEILLESLEAPSEIEAGARAIRDELIGRYFAGLPASRQRLLQALAVLGGSAQVDAVMTVAGDESTRADLNMLLDRWLVVQSGAFLAIHDTERAYYISTMAPATLRQGYLRAAGYWHACAKESGSWRTFSDAEPAIHEISLLSLAGEHPEAGSLRLAAAERLLKIGHTLAASHLLSNAAPAERDLEPEPARLDLFSRALWKSGDYAGAHAQCKGGLALAKARGYSLSHPHVLSMRSIEASCELELGRADRAVNAYKCLLADLDAPAGNDLPAHGSVEHVQLSITRAKTLRGMAFAASVAGHQQTALEQGTRSIELLRPTSGAAIRSDDPCAAALLYGLACVGLIHSYIGEFQTARSYYIEGYHLAGRIAAPYESAILFGNFAELELIEGRIDRVLDLGTKALAAESDTDAVSGSWCNWLIGMALSLEARLDQAERHIVEACRFTRLLNDPNPRVLFGILLARRGEKNAAIKQLEEAWRVSDQLVAACATNWEALIARALAQLVLAAFHLASEDDALNDYRTAYAASPYPGHFARIALQLRIAEPILSRAGMALMEPLRDLYGQGPEKH